VQARRRVEPTGTNRPTGLIAPVIRVREMRLQEDQRPSSPMRDDGHHMLAEEDTRRRSTLRGPVPKELRCAGLVA
ncbi:hypothetical protein, partial [Methylobacterium sp. 2A]|uniref:hypothetical protein n=1 Tax=Methylobacterium sp. 2A TaxID=2603816 RepID=UPI001AED2651